jgi:CRP/FNR family cyclic AMP-dependent transcriptional regulator
MNTIASNALKCAPLFGDLSEDEVAQIASLFKARNFSKGDIVVKEGLGGAAFFVIRSGEALVSIGGEPRATLSSGDFFGEIALFDEETRMATITAATDLNCYGLTYWDFRPLVEENGVIGWKLLQRMAEMLRVTRKEQAE